MRINDLLKEYGKFTLDDEYDGLIGDETVRNGDIVVNTTTEFKLRDIKKDGSSFELSIQAPTEKYPPVVISTWYTPDGEVYMCHKDVNGMVTILN